jgi:hypothetical protein
MIKIVYIPFFFSSSSPPPPHHTKNFVDKLFENSAQFVSLIFVYIRIVLT